MKMKKWTAGLAAVAIAVGALPTLVTPAAAYEEKGKGQHFIRRPIAIAIGVVSVLMAVILLTNDDKPKSP